MDRQRVHSTNLSSVGYDRATSTLEIEFQNGHIYQYLLVPAATFASLMAASSKGAFFTDHIKGRFPFRQLR